MEKISELIKRLCPEGVEKVRLDSICTFQRGKTITAKDAIEGAIPVIAGGQTPSYYHNEANRIGESVTIAGSGAYAGFVSYWNTPIYVSDAFTVDPQECLLHEYLYQYLKLNQQKIFDTQKGAGVPHVHGKDIANFKIPLPPLPIQQEIVRILDSFTSMITNLETELASRQKQYEYYRNKLLTFDQNDESVEWKTLGDLFEFKNGLNKEKDAFGHGTPIVNYTDVYKNRGLYRNTIKGLVSLNDSEIIRYSVKKGDVFFTRTSETKEEVGYPAVMLEDIEQCTFSGFVLKAHPFTSLLIPEYCKYCFFSFSFRQEVIKRATLTTRALTNGKSLSKITIPIPSLQRQCEIVSTLDTFESLITNIKQELDARKKQYEYYREKLLTFE